MDFNLTEEQVQIREEIRKVCQEFPNAYWRELDQKREYPQGFVQRLTELGWLAALIPEEYGGSGLGITEASIILEEIIALEVRPRSAMRRCIPWVRSSAMGAMGKRSATFPKLPKGRLACRLLP